MTRPRFQGDTPAELIRLMDDCSKKIDAWPDEVELEMADMDNLEEARHSALRLASVIEAVFETIRGTKS